MPKGHCLAAMALATPIKAFSCDFNLRSYPLPLKRTWNQGGDSTRVMVSQPSLPTWANVFALPYKALVSFDRISNSALCIYQYQRFLPLSTTFFSKTQKIYILCNLYKLCPTVLLSDIFKTIKHFSRSLWIFIC